MPFNSTFLKIYRYCGGFERKLSRVGLIHIKLSSDRISRTGRFDRFRKIAWIIGL